MTEFPPRLNDPKSDAKFIILLNDMFFFDKYLKLSNLEWVYRLILYQQRFYILTYIFKFVIKIINKNFNLLK